ncbi:hypothetical protein [Seonamhaeicola sp. ML3]|uniref:hypothetical protein n=1 Tax=Seonamhaeicola sp. ML3 TaxID=2937786 RepID=UPI00200FA232|nr:hypothetical protein [Seonamhaeicola sp. ML3]
MNTDILTYFINLENNPILFTNQLLNTHKNIGHSVPVSYEDFDLVIYDLKYLVDTYNTHLPDTKFINNKKLNLLLDNCKGDIPLFILMMYLVDVQDDIIPNALTNLKTLYNLIQKTYNQLVKDNFKSGYDGDIDFTVILISDELRS